MHACNLPEPYHTAAALHGREPCWCSTLPPMGCGSGRQNIPDKTHVLLNSSTVGLFTVFRGNADTVQANTRFVLNLLLTHNSFAVAGCSLLVLAAEEKPVPLLLQLLCGGTFLRAAGHLLHRLRGARLALLPYPVPRLSGWLVDRFSEYPVRTGSRTLDEKHKRM